MRMLQKENFQLSQLNRKTVTIEDLDKRFVPNKLESDNVIKSVGSYCLKYYKPSGLCLGSYILDRLPIIQWLREYNLKENTLPDLISGITIGIVHIPQGLAYALLASLPAVTGLYVSFFAVMMYVLLGTSKHLSIGNLSYSMLYYGILKFIIIFKGTFAITSLMTANTLSKFEGKLYPTQSELTLLSNPNNTFSNMQYISNDPVEAKILISMCLTFFSGLFQVF
jgi:MFS superfamily sulfate permease-like transporter